MAFCIKCGQELSDGAKFCACCGAEISAEIKKENKQRETVYDGKLHKCPNCGEFLNAFVTVCPVCGYEIRGSQTTSCVHELSQKLEKADSDEQKAELISNFYIPNTKEDIYEFFILAYSNITVGGNAKESWTIKLEQAYLKAKLAFGNSEEFTYIKELYEKINKVSRKKGFAAIKSSKGIVLMIIGALLAIISMVTYYILTLSNIWWYKLNDITNLGYICFAVGLILFILPNIKWKRRK